MKAPFFSSVHIFVGDKLAFPIQQRRIKNVEHINNGPFSLDMTMVLGNFITTVTLFLAARIIYKTSKFACQNLVSAASLSMQDFYYILL